MNPSPSGPYAIPPDDDREGWKCGGCGTVHALTRSLSRLRRLGLLPFRCISCGCLRVSRTFPKLRSYMLGHDA